MPTMTMKEGVHATMRGLAALALAASLALPTAAFADTSLGIRVYDSKQTPSAGDGATELGIKVTGPTYTVTWDANGGVFSDGSTKTTSVKWGTPTTAPGEPTREGYEFEGWSDAQSGRPVSQLPQETIGEATWYAVWKSLSYTIVFEPNGGEGGVDPMEIFPGQNAILPSSGLFLDGYTLAGWNTELDGSGEPYICGAAVPTARPGETVTLYAQWALQVKCAIPTAVDLTIDASGRPVGEDLAFVSGSVAPLEVSAVKSARLAGAESVFSDPATLAGVRVTLEPPASAGSAVQVPLETSADGQPAVFVVPAKGTLAVSLGLSLPANAKLSFVESSAEICRLSYVIGAAPSS